ncbi:hypothetical protein GLOTRDRAFT_133870 [Gloeophyllum trabeum ATCC 11539]|uniref:Amino acid permease/ SLC12A domain-containing protein n=1 Tax=Gloeophyllum trabeum (strain ATCC 11539 / FP-39264 / Madison 617) TaxID=670483 RepID=S7PT63_GLOTA|nr:uncharacterized protein GLOTRDRAFT_133870 [Gloeophyllum trabeum ATCC 11539]EPQ50497.1 hypothetical protein GLOTRDRAFT_133870 [Gloeophyllum trabeum ATCC 11539]
MGCHPRLRWSVLTVERRAGESPYPIIDTIGTKAIGGMSSFNVWWTLGGMCVLVIKLLVKAPGKNSAEFVFTDFENFTGWGSRGFVVLLGFLQAVYTLEGCGTAAQVAEEAKNAAVLATLAVVFSIVRSWLIGLAYMLALLFSVQSVASIQGTSYAIPIAQLYYDAVGKRLRCSWSFYALARDNAMPMRGRFMALNRNQAPYFGVWVSVLIGCIISCAYIGFTVAFNAILSSAAVAVMLSYL